MASKFVEKLFLQLAPFIIVLAGVMIILVIIADSRGTTKQNNAYVRVINCIVSKNANTRTQDDIEQCYQIVERESNIKLQRYDRQ